MPDPKWLGKCAGERVKQDKHGRVWSWSDPLMDSRSQVSVRATTERGRCPLRDESAVPQLAEHVRVEGDAAAGLEVLQGRNDGDEDNLFSVARTYRLAASELAGPIELVLAKPATPGKSTVWRSYSGLKYDRRSR